MAESSTNGKGKDEAEDARPPNSGRSTTTHESAPGDGADDRGYAEDDLDVLKRGATVGRYLVLERLGAGAMGVVYAAYDPELDRKVAIKLLRPSEGRGDPARRQARLVREAKAMAKLSHANVGAIFDVGVHDGQVFLAIEYLPGGTLRSWLDAEKRPWREIVRMFIEVGNGLAAAHAEGLIHRDFKPDNVLLDKAGKPKVVDFGLVRLSAALDISTTGSLDDADLPVAETAIPASSPVGLAALTRTGALAGTPAYMAPEQFLGKAIDERTDQFAFCVALYEALYGERPFAGETVIGLADAVTSQHLRASPNDGNVPGRLRRNLVRGLRADPVQRHRDMKALLDALQNDPVQRFRRRLGVGAAAVAVGLAFFGLQRRAERRRVEFERRIGGFLTEGTQSLGRALAMKDAALSLRERAIGAFDSFHVDDGERLWTQYRPLASQIDESLQHAQDAFGSALELDRQRGDARERLIATLGERASLAETEGRTEDLDAIRRHLASVLPIGAAHSWDAPATYEVALRPAPRRVTLEEFLPDGAGRLVARTVNVAGDGAPGRGTVRPGSYRLRILTQGGKEILIPFLAEPGSTVRIAFTLPNDDAVPEGFLFIPAGNSLFGDANEDLRTSFLNTIPVHKVHSHAFLIGRTEVRISDWLRFLADLSPAERKRLAPAASNVSNSVRLEPSPSGSGWRYVVTLGSRTLSFEQGEPIVYPGREGTMRGQNWMDLPVTGVSVGDVSVFLKWFRTQLPRARLCSELEWERAARGADSREYPASIKKLLPRDADIDATYGRVPTAFGPDAVGSHPASESPFGVMDLAGNVWEMTTSVLASGGYILRGGSFYHGAIAAAATNREPVDDRTRSPVMGFRVCSDVMDAN